MMRKIDWFYQTTSRHFLKKIHKINQIKQPFSDADILEIQEKFLSKGFQYLKSQNINQGRKIVFAFLDSLALYHDIACLTLDPQPIRENITDLYAELYHGNYLQSGQQYLEEYFIEQFYFDFLWIEASSLLLRSPWFDQIKIKLIDLSIDQQIPILVCVYTET